MTKQSKIIIVIIVIIAIDLKYINHQVYQDIAAKRMKKNVPDLRKNHSYHGKILSLLINNLPVYMLCCKIKGNLKYLVKCLKQLQQLRILSTVMFYGIYLWLFLYDGTRICISMA